MTASNKLWDLHRPFLHGRKGASGSWAEPCFACLTLRCGGFAYPPGILEYVLTREIKEKRILGSIPYNWITAKILIRLMRTNGIE